MFRCAVFCDQLLANQQLCFSKPLSDVFWMFPSWHDHVRVPRLCCTVTDDLCDCTFCSAVKVCEVCACDLPVHISVHHYLNFFSICNTLSVVSPVFSSRSFSSSVVLFIYFFCHFLVFILTHFFFKSCPLLSFFAVTLLSASVM